MEMHQTVSKKLNLTFVFFKNSGVSGKLSRLVLSSLTIADEGEYKCRVDYSQAPTSSHSVRLSILVPPSPPVIYDEHNIPLSHVVGPFHLGSNLTLKCITRGGRSGWA